MRMTVPRIVSVAGAALAAYSAYAWYAARRFEQLDAEEAGAPGWFVDVDSARLHYVTAGQGDPVVLIHGLGASTFTFRHTIPDLARHYRVIALDLQGSGFSARPPGADYSLTTQADLIDRALEQLDVSSAAVVGHSLGGAVAMRLALRHPDRVSRLVLVDSASDRELRRGVGLSRLLQPWALLFAPFTLHSRRFRAFALRTAVHDPAHVTPDVVDGYVRPSRVKGHLRAYAALMAQRGRDEPLALERISQPTLILWGEHDRWLPSSRGEALAEAIPDARLVLVPSAGHQALEEQPEYCNTVLLEFLGAEQATDAPKMALARRM